jgi:hypothetical protein
MIEFSYFFLNPVALQTEESLLYPHIMTYSNIFHIVVYTVHLCQVIYLKTLPTICTINEFVGTVFGKLQQYILMTLAVITLAVLTVTL